MRRLRRRLPEWGCLKMRAISALRNHRVAQLAYALDTHDAFIARPQKPRRLPAGSHAQRSPGRDHVAGLERYHRRDELDQLRNAENQLARVRMLQRLAADLERN